MRVRSIIPAPCAGVSSQWRDRDLFHLSPEQLITALKPLDTLQDVVKQYLGIPTTLLILCFWIRTPTRRSSGRRSQRYQQLLVALEFTGGGLDDIMEFAVNHQIRYFVQGSKIYVDARKEAGLFLILA